MLMAREICRGISPVPLANASPLWYDNHINTNLRIVIMNSNPIETKNYRKPKTPKRKKFAKGIFSAAIVIQVLISITVVWALGSSVYAWYTDTFTPGLRYDITSDTECTVTGIGYTKDTELVIPDNIDGYTVTAIGNYAFEGKKFLRITLPDTLKEIGIGAFSECLRLESIAIPAGVTYIGRGAFSECPRLESIAIPAGVTYIGDWAFSECSSLTDITLPDGIHTVNRYTFWKCSSLKNVTIGKNVTYIGESAFSNCSSLSSVTVPEGVTSVGNGAFFSCESLTDMTLPSSVTAIGETALFSCRSLKSINYGGTADEWSAIAKGANMTSYNMDYTVYCTDGTVDNDGNATYY
jgi:hypothetical protein